MNKFLDFAMGFALVCLGVSLLALAFLVVLDKEWDRQRIQCEHREAQGYDVDCGVYYDY